MQPTKAGGHCELTTGITTLGSNSYSSPAMSEDPIAPNAQPFRGLGFRASVAIMGIYSNYYGFPNIVTYGQNLRKSQSCMCRLYANIEISWHAVEVKSYGFGVVLEL